MSYTNADALRQYLSSPYPTLDSVLDQPLTLRNLDTSQFFGGAVEAETVVVKSLQTNQLTRTTSAFVAGVLSVGSGHLVRGSVLIATDSSLGEIFTENLDYIVDYATGSITRKTGGTLSDGVAYTIWYAPYTAYQLDTDYELNADAGEINRLNGGAIASGETVLIDFVPIYASFGEEVLELAAIEANAMVETEIDPQQQYGGNPILRAAATCLALAIVCRAAASRELSRLRGEERTASGWIKLAESYAERGEQLVKTFRPAMTGPAAPTH